MTEEKNAHGAQNNDIAESCDEAGFGDEEDNQNKDVGFFKKAKTLYHWDQIPNFKDEECLKLGIRTRDWSYEHLTRKCFAPYYFRYSQKNSQKEEGMGFAAKYIGKNKQSTILIDEDEIKKFWDKFIKNRNYAVGELIKRQAKEQLPGNIQNEMQHVESISRVELDTQIKFDATGNIRALDNGYKKLLQVNIELNKQNRQFQEENLLLKKDIASFKTELNYTKEEYASQNLFLASMVKQNGQLVAQLAELNDRSIVQETEALVKKTIKETNTTVDMKNLTTEIETAMANNTKARTTTADDINVKTTTANDINVQTDMDRDMNLLFSVTPQIDLNAVDNEGYVSGSPNKRARQAGVN